MKANPVLFAKALADETRQKIMSACCCREVSVGELAEKFNLTQPTISHHLAILREAGLVNAREEGKQTFYTLNQERLAYCCGQLMIKFAPEAETTQTLQHLIES